MESYAMPMPVPPPPNPPSVAQVASAMSEEMHSRLAKLRELRKTKMGEFKACVEEVRGHVEREQKRTPSGAFRLPTPAELEAGEPLEETTVMDSSGLAGFLPSHASVCTPAPASLDDESDIESVESAVMKAVEADEDPVDAGFAALRAQRAQRKARLAEHKKTAFSAKAAQKRASTSKMFRFSKDERAKLDDGAASA